MTRHMLGTIILIVGGLVAILSTVSIVCGDSVADADDGDMWISFGVIGFAASLSIVSFGAQALQ